MLPMVDPVLRRVVVFAHICVVLQLLAQKALLYKLLGILLLVKLLVQFRISVNELTIAPIDWIPLLPQNRFVHLGISSPRGHVQSIALPLGGPCGIICLSRCCRVDAMLRRVFVGCCLHCPDLCLQSPLQILLE